MEKIVLKVGGSLLSKSAENYFDYDYARKLDSILKTSVDEGNKFILITGGGTVMRTYRDQAEKSGITDVNSLHWIGTAVNVVNAYVLAAVLGDKVADVLRFDDYYSDKKIDFGDKPYIVGGGGRPGHSGDYDAILAGQKVGAKTIISLKNIDGVYEADPKVKPEAKKVDRLTWNEYFQIIGYKTSHEPGGNYPIDPVSAEKAKDLGLKFVVVHGGDFENLAALLRGDSFVGTIVTDN